jgi:hypothetical protein
MLTACATTPEPTGDIGAPLPPGFGAYATQTVEISLPRTFLQLDPVSAMTASEAALATRKPGLATQTSSQTPSSGNVEFLAMDSESAVPGAVTSVLIFSDHTIPARPLVQVARAVVDSHPEALDVEEAPFSIPGVEAVKVAYRTQLTTLSITQVHYIVSVRGAAWSIVFTTPSEEYEEREDQFDASALSFHVLRAPSITDYLRDNSQSLVTLLGATLIVAGALVSRLRRRRHVAPDDSTKTRS